MAKTKQQLLSRIYDDPKNYPYGFRRSGDFSINESDALSKYGCLFNALYKGEITASDEQDNRIISIMRGEASAESVEEVAWQKYQSRLNRPKLGSLYGNKKQSIDLDDGDDSDDDVDLSDDLGDGLDSDSDE
ncbi:DUF413 domain-containing protein [Catenovulum sp. 2E275]|uniref:DUF413 domain-containing protein n=1 Tax=Catenovulum sp. 2E275 TaxID=2980497 RepID=UPI0021CE6679|nr:DUF413 domain-containing protein [Catenovulum sp. 2E275]MCU4674421.1 DUF413 domain-containing protein [Catenovulum sp. 2E275]